MGPRPILGHVAEPGPDGVLDHIAARLVEMAFTLDRPGRKPVSEEVAESDMTLVEPLCVAAVQALNPARELYRRRVKNEVVVRGHEAKRVDDPSVPLRAGTEVHKEGASVYVISEDRAPVDAT
jgi:hypothetical protein